MTPVDAKNTVFSLQSRTSAAALAVMVVASVPFLPVKAFALPELITMALALPLERCFLHQSTGAEEHLDLVKTPAISAGLPNAIRQRSFLPTYFMPASTEASMTSSITGSSGYSFGASGDTLLLIETCNSQKAYFSASSLAFKSSSRISNLYFSRASWVSWKYFSLATSCLI